MNLHSSSCWLENGQLAIDADVASKRWPLLGLCGPIAWSFDGVRLRMALFKLGSRARPTQVTKVARFMRDAA